MIKILTLFQNML